MLFELSSENMKWRDGAAFAIGREKKGVAPAECSDADCWARQCASSEPARRRPLGDFKREKQGK